MSKKFQFLIIIFLITQITCLGQSIEHLQIYIGQTSSEVQNIVAKEVQTHYNARDWLTKTSAKTNYVDGRISEIMMLKENVMIEKFNKGANYCVHYVMSRDTLSHIITEYFNLTLQEVRALLVNAQSTNVHGYYFDRYLKSYCKVYLSGAGTVIEYYQKAIMSALPLAIQEQLQMLNKKFD
ncbi:hypothetical protein KXQ82_05790 [Mucilaginibacter sp. HMF5004]|uniref:hypothetical protein n=1 Tax=Mucilaginibacter rivuli TaxID=2857527 RepID=UPI001C5EB448|nr:hypothetical protein [Mucilaginibacter rivuli]MBW4889215.1 hypothetical protein [Mucilaginibacter rivuli]